MKVRRNVTRPDTSAWPEFDPGTLATALRKTFGARRRAVEMFAADSSLTEIEAQTGVNRRQVYRALESAPALHADGRPYGWRAWVPHTRVGDYHRLAKVRRHAVGLGTAGAFGLLLGAQQMHDRLRFCTASMALAYHGVMHQRVGASRCPWQGVALEEHCRGCGASAPYRLNARLLGSPFRCAECRRPYAGWSARLTPQAAPPELRRAITRARCGC